MPSLRPARLPRQLAGSAFCYGSAGTKGTAPRGGAYSSSLRSSLPAPPLPSLPGRRLHGRKLPGAGQGLCYAKRFAAQSPRLKPPAFTGKAPLWASPMGLFRRKAFGFGLRRKLFFPAAPELYVAAFRTCSPAAAGREVPAERWYALLRFAAGNEAFMDLNHSL